MPVTNGLRNRGLKRKIGSDDDDEEEKDQGLAPAVTKSREDETKLKMKREIPPVVTFELPEEESSSEEEEEPIQYSAADAKKRIQRHLTSNDLVENRAEKTRSTKKMKSL